MKNKKYILLIVTLLAVKNEIYDAAAATTTTGDNQERDVTAAATKIQKAWRGRKEAIQRKRKKIAELQANIARMTPKEKNEKLVNAAQQGYLGVVNALIEAGADVNVRSGNGHPTPLHLAAEAGHLSVVEYLVEHDADVNAANRLGEKTPLYLAALQGHLNVVKYLVEHGADVNAVETPLHFAAYAGNLDIVKYFIEHGADVNAAPRRTGGDTPLHIAAERGNLDIVEYLVEAGADVNIKNVKGNIALYKAALIGYWEIVSYLIQYSEINHDLINRIESDISELRKYRKSLSREYRKSLEREYRKKDDATKRLEKLKNIVLWRAWKELQQRFFLEMHPSLVIKLPFRAHSKAIHQIFKNDPTLSVFYKSYDSFYNIWLTKAFTKKLSGLIAESIPAKFYLSLNEYIVEHELQKQPEVVNGAISLEQAIEKSLDRKVKDKEKLAKEKKEKRKNKELFNILLINEYNQTIKQRDELLETLNDLFGTYKKRSEALQAAWQQDHTDTEFPHGYKAYAKYIQSQIPGEIMYQLLKARREKRLKESAATLTTRQADDTFAGSSGGGGRMEPSFADCDQEMTSTTEQR